MKHIISSASKIVFIMMALGVHAALFSSKITGEQYMVLAGMAFTFYFANKGEASEPYAGK
jgi:arginine exporter protein ArgO